MHSCSLHWQDQRRSIRTKPASAFLPQAEFWLDPKAKTSPSNYVQRCSEHLVIVILRASAKELLMTPIGNTSDSVVKLVDGQVASLSLDSNKCKGAGAAGVAHSVSNHERTAWSSATCQCGIWSGRRMEICWCRNSRSTG